MKKKLILILSFIVMFFYPLISMGQSFSKEDFKNCDNCHRDPKIKEKLTFPGQFEERHTHLAHSNLKEGGKKLVPSKNPEELSRKPKEKELIDMEIFYSAGDEYIDLNWEIPVKFTLAKKEISGYRISYGTESGYYDKKFDVGNTNNYRLAGLKKYTSYYLVIQAYSVERDIIGNSKEIGPVHLPQIYIMSDIEKNASGKISPEISLELRQFGYNIFGEKEGVFNPQENISVGPDYVIGPGDSLNINVWGSTEMEYAVTVDRDGKINIPKIGTILVSGMTYEQVKVLIFEKLSQIISNFKISLSLGNIHSIKVFIVGEVQNPGSYDLSSLSTVISSLFAAQGPTKKGSMRGIKLFRNNQLLRTLDLYRFLIEGDKSDDLRLESGDTVFIPIIGKVAAIAGNVRRPAIFEIKDNTSLKDIIDLAGGITAKGNLSRLQIERTSSNEKNIVTDINLKDFYDKGDNSQNIDINDGDLVKIFSIYPLSANFVELNGNIQYPGRYELKPSMRLSELFAIGGKFLPETYMDRVEIERTLLPDKQKKIISIDLGKLLKGEINEDLILVNWDKITIFSVWDFKRKPTVKIEGKVNKPDSYDLLTDMRISDLIYRAGGLETNAYLFEAELTRLEKDEQGLAYSRIIPVNLQKILGEKNKKEDLLLKEYDYLLVKEISDWRNLQGTITLKGEFSFPGVYPLRKGERLSSIIERANGYTKEAFLRGVIFSREVIRKEEEKLFKKFIATQEEGIIKQEAALVGTAVSEEELKTFREMANQRKEALKLLANQKPLGRILINIEKVEQIKGVENDIVLEDGDDIFVPKTPSAISVFGEVYNPAAILYQEGVSLDYYINQVGGLKKSADADEIYVIKADGSVISNFNKNKLASQRGYILVDYDIDSLKIERGDTIFIPEKFVEKVRWWQVTKDTIDMFSKLALGTGAMWFIFK